MMTRLGGVLAVAVLSVSLTACQADDDPSDPSAGSTVSQSPTASPSPSVEPSEAAIAERAAEAEKRYREYLQITDRHRIEGTRAFQELFEKRGLLGEPAMWDSVKADDDLYASEKVKQVGKTGIASMEVSGYDGDPLAKGIDGHRVNFSVCLDYSGIDVVRENGTSVAVEGQPLRVIADVVMQGQKDSTWTVNEVVSPDEEC